jgi:hypothetical protein
VLPANVSLEVVGAFDPEFEPATWWQSRQGRKTFLLETLGYLAAVWELRDQHPGSSAGGAALGLTSPSP